MRIRPPSPALVVALLALVVATGGSAVAASLITSAQIKDGTVQAKDLSAKARTSLRGKAGPRGPAGPAGGAGATGARGPSDAFVFTHQAGITLPNTATPLAAALPAGTYVILAKFQVNNNDAANSVRPFCTLAAGADTDTAEPGTSSNNTSDDTAGATLTLTHTFTAAGTATLSCTDGGATAILMEDAVITAIQVASATVRTI